jgi:hypothetical protein
MTGGDPTPATSEQVANWLRQDSVSIPMYDIEYMAGDDDQHTFNWAYGQPEFVNHWRAMQQTRASKHAQWLTEEQNKLLQKIKRGERVAHGPFLAHEQTLPGPDGKPQGPGKVFEHYNLTDTNMLWRFTSKPSEYIWIAPHVAYEDIIGVTARHSGGNDKSNQDVKDVIVWPQHRCVDGNRGIPRRR